ncbi:MAG TPA: hypothetical protein VF193_12610 [Steroidobacter sp.]
MINAIHVYRATRWLDLHRVPASARMRHFVGRVFFACCVRLTAKIGRRVLPGYGGAGIVTHTAAIIGDDSHIDQPEEHAERRRDHGFFLWKALQLAVWYEHYPVSA